MTRETAKHGPRMDDALARETRALEQRAPLEPRSREDLEKEGPADGERDVDSRTAPPGSLGSDGVEARRELSRHLRASVFPADRYALFAEANGQGAPEAVLDSLHGLPAGRQYRTVHEVWAALGGYEDLRGAAAREQLTDGDR